MDTEQEGRSLKSYEFCWADDGDILIRLTSHEGDIVEVLLDESDRDKFLKIFKQSCKRAKRDKRKAERG